MAPPRKSVLLARELAEDPPRKFDGLFLNPYVLHRLCELATEKNCCGDDDGLRVAQLCCRLAQQLDIAEGRALSFGRLATALRIANRLVHAERALAIAVEAAPDNLLGDLYRRRAWLRIYQHRLIEAVEDGRTAVGKTTGQAKAQAHEVLGVALFSSGAHEEGTNELENCLEATDPDAETAYCNALHNYATALGQCSEEGAREALPLLEDLRSKLKDRHKIQRAKIWWTIGLLQERLSEHQKAWVSLNTARRSLIALEAAPEIAAIVADMARIAFEPPAVRHICTEATAVIGDAHPLAGPLGNLSLASRDTFQSASAELRAAASQLAQIPQQISAHP